MNTVTEEIDLRTWARSRVRDHRRSRRLRILNRLLGPVCILVVLLAVREILRYGMPAAIAAFSVVGIFCLFAWRAR